MNRAGPGRAGYCTQPGRVIKTGPGTAQNRAGPGRVRDFDRASERTSDRASEGEMEREIERASERATIERSRKARNSFSRWSFDTLTSALGKIFQIQAV